MNSTNDTSSAMGGRCDAPHNSALAVASLGFGTFAQVTCEFAPIGVLPEVATHFDVSSGSAGLMMTLPGIFAAVSALLVATVIRKANRKPVLLALALMLVMSSIVCGVAPTFELLLAGRALLGICLGASWTIALSTASRVAAQGKVHQAAAAVFAGVTAAMILGLPMGTLIADATSWRITFLAGAALGAIALLLQFLYLPNLPAGKFFKLSNHIKFLKHPSAIASLALAYLGHAAHFGAYTFLAPALKEASIVGSNLTYLLFAFGLIGFAANFTASALVRRRLTETLAAAQITLGAALLLMIASDTVTFKIIATLLWGIAWGMLPLALNMWNRQSPDGGGESGSALFIVTAQAAIASSSFFGGSLYDAFGLSSTYAAAVFLSLVSVVILYFASQRS